MVRADKVFKLYAPVTKAEDNEDGSITISGYASTNDQDRSGDVIVSDAWKKSGALENYLKNPVVLAYHDMTKPIGKTISHETDETGLKITARISKAAADIIDLIKDGILSAFSVGFMINDADWDSKSGVFIIKDLELYEVSVVSVPANQNTLFAVEKNFSNAEEYNEFKKQFIKGEETLMVDKTNKDGEKSVDIAALASQVSELVAKKFEAEAELKKAKEEREKKDAEKMEATAVTAAERLIKDLRDELVEKDKNLEEVLGSVKEALKAQSENGDLEKAFGAERTNKMKFDKSALPKISEDLKDGILYAAKVAGIPATETKAFKELVKKSNMEHWDSGVVGEWEADYSTRVYDALRQQLVVEPLFSSIPMTTPTLNLPINPEAGDATWVHSNAYRSSKSLADETGDGTDTSTGAATNHELDEQVLIAYKLATREYVGYEEEEDSIVTLAPIIREAVTRRMARASDKAFLRGGGVLTSASFDPILGLHGRGANTTDVTVTGGASWKSNLTEDAFVDMRRNLGLYGLDPSQLILLVSHDTYYEMVKFPNFKTIDVMGPNATLITGQVGAIWGVKVLVSQMFDNAAVSAGTVGTVVATLVRPSNFVKGELRGITTEADKDIINQKRVIVSSRRFAFQDIITGEATVNLDIAS